MVSLLFSLLVDEPQWGAGPAPLLPEFSFVNELEGRYSEPGGEAASSKLSLNLDCYFFRQELGMVLNRMERELRRSGWFRTGSSDGSVQYAKEERRAWLYRREYLFGSRPKEFLCFLALERPEGPFTYVPRLTRQQIERLAPERGVFLNQLMTEHGTGYLSGEGYTNAYLFPAGLSDRVYYLSGVAAHWAGTYSEPRHYVPRDQSLALYARVDDEINLLWTVKLAEGRKRTEHGGSLAEFIYHRGQRPVDVPEFANDDFDRRMALAHYERGHGVAPLWAWFVSFDGTIVLENDFEDIERDVYDFRLSEGEERLLVRGY